MDAHTLNAWTRFALQKGGIGTCTALIDNPATDQEDLMFMTGERIIVLRRLDEDSLESSGRPTSTGGKRKSAAAGGPQDAEAWFLGYCEGVVGRFKGGHVQFHGRLKKPVLMRRSGAGSVRESSTQPIFKSEAASLHASQVPLGIPVAALGSDGEEGTTGAVQGYGAGRSVSPANMSKPGAQSSAYDDNKQPQQLRSAARQRSNPAFGVTTPPLSDEGHNRKAAMMRSTADDEDSDDSASMLPWARHSRESSAASHQTQEAGTASLRLQSEPSSSSPLKNNVGRSEGVGMLNSRQKMHELATHNLPPSPISSNESPTHRDSADQSRSIPDLARVTIRAPSPNGESNTSRASSSYTTSTTEESDDEGAANRRRDYAFSIYDVYGRDSVAFPNFNYREAYGADNRIGASKSSESLAAQSNREPLSASSGLASGGAADSSSNPVTLTEMCRPDPLDSSPAMSLRSPITRRPSAAPDPRMNDSRASQNIASSLRRQVEASTPTTSTFLEAAQVGTNAAPRGPGSFDPRRRPSAGNALAPGLNASTPVNQNRMPATQQASRPPDAPSSSSNQLSSASMKRPGFAEAREQRRRSWSLSNARPDLQGDANLGVSASGSRPDFRVSTGSAEKPIESPRRKNPNLSSPNMGPVRASSDRLSERERIHSGSGNGLLRKNPSNPTPGLHGGSGMHSMSPMARSGSLMGALAIPSPNSDMTRRVSESSSVGTAPRSPLSEGATTPTRAEGLSMPIRFDALGFVTPGGPLALPQADDPEAREKWMALFKEDDSASTRKSRKVKKLVRQGIPPSVRGQAWLYLANASVRRRVGLFEQLCKTSQGNKGKKGKETLYESIDKDLDRSFPDHKLFIGEKATGKADLEAILKSYVHFNPIIGYTQGMGLLVGLALIQMPAEDAFWLLCAVLRDPHMEGYYTSTMKQLHVDSVVFGNLLATMDPELHRRFGGCGLEPIMFTPSWFLPLFVRVLPWNTLIRVWDVFFFEGPSWILRVALAIVRIIREPLMDRRACPGHGEMLQMLLHPPQAQLTPDNVLNCAFSVKLKDGEMRKLSRNASTLVRENNMLGKPLDGRERPPVRRSATGSRSTSAPAKR